MSRQFSYRQQSERMRLPPPVLRRSVGHFGYRFESTGQPCWRGCWPSPGTGSADTLAHQWRSRTWGEEVEISSRTVGMTAAKITRTKVSAMSYKHKLQLLELQTASEFKTLLHFKAFLPWSWSSISALGWKPDFGPQSQHLMSTDVDEQTKTTLVARAGNRMAIIHNELDYLTTKTKI